MYKLSFRQKDFISVTSKMIGADKSDLGVMGAVVVDLSCQDGSGATRTSKELFYVCDRLDKVFLSYTGLQTLGSVSS